MATSTHAPRRTPNARGRASRTRLLEAAAVCFGRDGYLNTRISDITAEAEMAPASFYRHFPDKTALLLEALEGPLDALLTATGPLTEHSTVDAAAIVERNTEFFRVYAEHRRTLRVLRELAITRQEGLDEIWLRRRREYVDRIAAWLRRLEAAGELETADVDVLADALGAVLDQLAYTRLGLATDEPTPADVETLGRVSGEIWLGTLTRAGRTG